MKPIYFTKHANKQLKTRNTNEAEVKWAIYRGQWRDAEKGRKLSSLTFPFMKEHFGNFYRAKKVEPIFIEKTDRIIVVTVYTFFL